MKFCPLRRLPFSRRVALALSLSLSLVVSASASAAVISVTDPADAVVPADGRCTLREAIDNANLAGGGDTTAGDCAAGDPGADTVEIPPGNYAIAIAAPPADDLNLAGDFDIRDDLFLLGSGADLTRISGDGFDRVLHVDPALAGIEVEILELTLGRGFLAAPSRGGGMLIERGARAYVENVFVEDNVAEIGAGIFNDGTLTMIQTTLQENRAEFGNDGGGLFNAGLAELLACDIRANNSEARGGGVLNGGQLSCQDCVFDFNTAIDGGGLFNAGIAELSGGGAGANHVTGDGGALHHSGTSLVVTGTLVINNSAEGNGAGLFSSGSGVELRQLEMLGNIALVDGGAVANTSGAVTLDEVTLLQNLCGQNGGGIANAASVQILGSTLRTNEAGERGGALFNTGSAEIHDSALDLNSAVEGGGVFTEGNLLTVGTSLIARNEASSRGGGVLATLGTQVNMLNTTISTNRCLEDGCGMIVEGLATLEFTTVADNISIASSPAGIHILGTLRVKNTIVADNFQGGDCIEAGDTVSSGYNLDTDGSCGFGAGPGDLPATNPNLGPLQYNSGPTHTHALLSPSPAIDSADPDCLTQFGGVVTIDQRHVPRPQDGDGDTVAVCDRGAFEVAAPSGPQPPVPNGIFGTAMRVDKLDPLGNDLHIGWDVGLCPSTGYHLIHGLLSDVSSPTPLGGLCGLNPAGSDVWPNTPLGSHWFLIVADDGAQTEGSWGDASAGIRGGASASGQCSMVARDNSGTCP
ncbi:MAG: hypothetical protein GY716_18530 [bacterium]|nr:hypothetical protein [bacterium]